MHFKRVCPGPGELEKNVRFAFGLHCSKMDKVLDAGHVIDNLLTAQSKFLARPLPSHCSGPRRCLCPGAPWFSADPGGRRHSWILAYLGTRTLRILGYSETQILGDADTWAHGYSDTVILGCSDTRSTRNTQSARNTQILGVLGILGVLRILGVLGWGMVAIASRPSRHTRSSALPGPRGSAT